MDFITNLWENHGVFFLVAVWPIATALLNIVLRKKTAKEWVAFAEKRPRSAGIIRLLRATGLDPAKAAKSLKEAVKGEAAKNTDKLSPNEKKLTEIAADLSDSDKERTPRP